MQGADGTNKCGLLVSLGEQTGMLGGRQQIWSMVGARGQVLQGGTLLRAPTRRGEVRLEGGTL